MLTSGNLEKLEWPLLKAKLAAYAQTDAGRNDCLALSPTLTKDQVTARWSDVIGLRDIARSGYKAPIGELSSPLNIFKAAEKGQLLEGVELRKILDILISTKKVLAFAASFSPKSDFLKRLRSTLYILPELLDLIEKTVGSNGELNDDASHELSEIRQLKTNLRKKIEDHLDRLITSTEVAAYLQDSFYTVRHERYVIPIRLDGRGRIKGQIVDTSDSGQTLFLEPTSVAQMNRDLHDLDVAEKLEIIRIFRHLSACVAKDLDTIRHNYLNLIDLDIKTAEASLAATLDAGMVEITDSPCLNLIEARHPLIVSKTGKTAVANTIKLETSKDETQKILIVSGPNAGGKTVVLKTVGLLHIMAQSGLLIPVEPSSKIFFFKNIFLELGDNQNITTNLSTFSGHLLGLKPILEDASPEDLALLDELATGTEPQTGSAIAQAVLEHLASKNVTAIVTTHFDSIKTLAINDKRYRNASMDYAASTYSPTYKLILDVPGQSFGLELAMQMGISQRVIDRAKQLRGSSQTDLDSVITSLQISRQKTEDVRINLEKELLAAEASKARWDEECRLIEEQRKKAAKSLAAKIETEVDTLRSEFQDSSRELKQVVKEIRTGTSAPELAYDKKRETEAKLRNLEEKVSSLAAHGHGADLPGTAINREDIQVNRTVYVLPLRREGVITKIGLSEHDPIEVQVGIIKVRVSRLDLRKTRDGEQKKADSPNKSSQASTAKTQPQIIMPEFVPQTPINTLDLRGSVVETALDKILNFLDRAIREDERYVVIIHGHGNERLKSSIRTMLKSSCPYRLSFRPGNANEGGDGVTVISLD